MRHFNFMSPCLRREKARLSGNLSKLTPANKSPYLFTAKKHRRRWKKSFRYEKEEKLKKFFIYFHLLKVTEFVERLMKHASNGEVLMFKKPLDARLHQLLTYIPELNLASIHELEFISNFQAIQV